MVLRATWDERDMMSFEASRERHGTVTADTFWSSEILERGSGNLRLGPPEKRRVKCQPGWHASWDF
jgi:hypothetical protein